MASSTAAPTTMASTIPPNTRDPTTSEVYYTLGKLKPNLSNASVLQRHTKPANSYDVEFVFSCRFVAYKKWDDLDTALVFEPGSTFTLSKAWCNQIGADKVDATDKQVETDGWGCHMPSGVLFEGMYELTGHPPKPIQGRACAFKQLTVGSLKLYRTISHHWVLRCVTVNSAVVMVTAFELCKAPTSMMAFTRLCLQDIGAGCVW
jgi:hypothetical protein